MSRLLLRLAPRGWRERYGPEVLDDLERSDRPRRDRLDLAGAVMGLRVDQVATSAAVTRRRPAVVCTGLLLVLAGCGLVARATTQLADGLVELPQHWWSTLAALPLLFGAVLLLMVRRSRASTG